VIAALLAALATATPSPSASFTPREIFDRTFTRLASYPVAPYAVEIATRHEVATSPQPGRGGTIDFAVRYAFRTSDGTENYAGYPVPSGALPPAGMARTQLGAFAWSARPSDAASPQRAGEPSLPDVPQPLKTIARVVAYGPPHYAIDVTGNESVDGHTCYHLRLRPIDDPRRHNLRELWVDAATFDLWKARFDGSYSPVPKAPSSQTSFTSIFAPIGSFWIVSRQHWTWTDVRDEIFVDINMEVNKIVFPATLPDFLFDQNEYDKRQRAGETDPLDGILNGQ